MKPQEVLAVMDDLTPYYRQQITSLPVQQRRVVCALGRVYIQI